MEQDYNGQVCDQTLELMLHASPELRNSVPKNLQGAEIRFTFESPLKDAIEKIKVGQFMEAQQVLAAAIQLDPSVALVLDNNKATRDVLGAVVPAAWLRTDADAQAMAAEQQAQQQSAQLLAMMEQGSVVAKNLGEASPTAGQGGAGGVL